MPDCYFIKIQNSKDFDTARLLFLSKLVLVSQVIIFWLLEIPHSVPLEYQ